MSNRQLKTCGYAAERLCFDRATLGFWERSNDMTAGGGCVFTAQLNISYDLGNVKTSATIMYLIVTTGS